MKIRSVEVKLRNAEDGRTDGRRYSQTDMTKLVVAFYKASKAPKNKPPEFPKPNPH
jgi:hypothetical protein